MMYSRGTAEDIEINFFQVYFNVKIPLPIKSEGYKILQIFLLLAIIK